MRETPPLGAVDHLELIDGMSDGVAVLDQGGRYVFLNREAQRMLDRPTGEIVGRVVWELFGDLAAPDSPFRRTFHETLSAGRAPAYEVYSNATSSWLRVRMVSCSLRSADASDARGVAVYFRDITARKTAELGRAESSGRFREMANHAPVLIWMSGTDANLDWFNQPWLEFTGRTLEQEVDDGWTETVHPEDFDFCVATFRGSFERRERFTMEYRMRRHDGEYRWILNNGTPRHTEDGAFVGYIGSCVDITEKKQAESEVARLLAATTDLAERQGEILEQQRAFLKDILFAVTEGVLRLCDGDSGLPPRSGRQAPISLPLTAPPHLPEIRRAVRAAVRRSLVRSGERAHASAAGEAASNVIAHANGTGEVRLHADPERGLVQMWLTDRGPGIALERLHRAVLERGFTTAGSLGHGFWLMLRTADRIYLLTREGEGTTVVIEQERIAPLPAWAEALGDDLLPPGR